MRKTRAVLPNKILLSSAIAASILSVPTHAMEEYFSTPGTRAMGMAGAYVAHASDSSAIWYNPAALNLSKGYTDFTIEYGDFVQRRESRTDMENDGTYDTYDYYESESSVKYLAFSGGGIGWAIFQPYKFNSFVEEELFSGDVLRNVDTTYYELKFAFAGEFIPSISWGMGIDLINQTVECEYCTYDDEDDASGFGGSLGVLGNWKLMEETAYPVSLKVGANYRSEAFMDDLILLDLDSDVIPSRPESLSYGFSIGMPFVIYDIPFYISTSYHYEELAYNDVLSAWIDSTNTIQVAKLAFEEERTAYGLELTTSFTNDFDLYLRMGSSETEVTDDGYSGTEEPYRPGTESSTIGVGIRFDKWIIDFAQETRTIDQSEFYTDDRDEDEDLTSLSLSYSW